MGVVGEGGLTVRKHYPLVLHPRTLIIGASQDAGATSDAAVMIDKEDAIVLHRVRPVS